MKELAVTHPSLGFLDFGQGPIIKIEDIEFEPDFSNEVQFLTEAKLTFYKTIVMAVKVKQESSLNKLFKVASCYINEYISLSIVQMKFLKLLTNIWELWSRGDSLVVDDLSSNAAEVYNFSVECYK